jgi:hypothetical protein
MLAIPSLSVIVSVERDTLKGKRITIIGTPHQPEFIYKLLAYSLGLDFDKESKLENRVVTYNGFRFRFKTYDDEVLRNIQMWMISSELEQAVGRARLLREAGGRVMLFSNFPVEQAVFAQPEYDKAINKPISKRKFADLLTDSP